MSDEKKEAPARAKRTVKQTYVMLKPGVTEGKSGKQYTHKAGQELVLAKGELDHLFDENGESTICEKK